jgi:hypothetical protein
MNQRQSDQGTENISDKSPQLTSKETPLIQKKTLTNQFLSYFGFKREGSRTEDNSGMINRQVPAYWHQDS